MYKKRILLVDDKPGITRAVKFILEKARGYVVREENDASQATRTALAFHPDLVVLDIAMPGTDGGSLASVIKSHPDLCDIPTMFYTGMLTEEEAATHRENHREYVVSKNSGPRSLLEHVDLLLARLDVKVG